MHHFTASTTTLGAKFRNDAAVRGYAGMGGMLGDLVVADKPLAARQQLTLVTPAAPVAPGTFPCGVEARVVDQDGRLRPQFAADATSRVLGWADGVLGTTLINGWLVLTQRAEHVGAKRGRCSDKAGFTVGTKGAERIALRPAHLHHLDAAPGTLLLLALIPDEGAVVVVNLALMARQAPPHVQPLLGVEPDRHLAVVTGSDDIFREEAQ